MSIVLLTARDVAKILNVRPVTVYAAASAGRLPSVRLWKGRRRGLVRFRSEDIEAFLRERTVTPEASQR
jgi:excisionase family DNA binding protein